MPIDFLLRSYRTDSVVLGFDLSQVHWVLDNAAVIWHNCNVDRSVESVKANWAAIKEYGAVNTR